MHGAWYILRWAWTAILIGYLLLSIVAAKRLVGRAKKRSSGTFWVVAVLAVFRMSIRLVLGGGLIYRAAILLVGIAAGLAALDLTRMLMEQKQENRIAEAAGAGQIQSLKLN